MPINGLHHVTAYASDPQENYDFMTEVLGLRLCRQTLLYAPGQSIYHLYYGNQKGQPGTVLTYFPKPNLEPGRVGQGQISSCAFTIPEDSIAYWRSRLDEHEVPYRMAERFDETAILLSDPDGLPLELVTGESDIEPWTGADVPGEHGIRGLHSVGLNSHDPAGTFRTLEAMEWERVGRDESPAGARIRYTPIERAGHGHFVDVLVQPNTPPWSHGTGTFVHVAFRVPDEEAQEAWRERFAEHDLIATGTKYRQEFRSMYLTEPGGSTFEFATDGPGFTEHEDIDELGNTLQIPEPLREMVDVPIKELKNQLPPFEPS